MSAQYLKRIKEILECELINWTSLQNLETLLDFTLNQSKRAPPPYKNTLLGKTNMISSSSTLLCCLIAVVTLRTTCPFHLPFNNFPFKSKSATPLKTTFTEVDASLECSTTLGHDVTLSGQYCWDGGLRIAGSFSGTLDGKSSATLAITSGGSCVSDVFGIDSLFCNGVLCGNVKVSHVHLGRDAKVVGDIICETMILEEGASILGVMQVGEEDEEVRADGPSDDYTSSNQWDQPQLQQQPVFNKYAPHSFSTQQPKQPPPQTNLNVDNFGNPLFRGPTNSQVDTLRRNRMQVRDARELMDKHRGKASVLGQGAGVGRTLEQPADEYNWRAEVDKTNQILRRGVDFPPPQRQSDGRKVDDDGVNDKKSVADNNDIPKTRFLGRFR